MNKTRITQHNSLIDRAINKTTNLPILDGFGSEEDTIYESKPINEVNFFDYEGTILYSYTVAEAQELTELPPLPSHKGLTCQGWNWTLEEIQSYNHPINVGAIYITDDGKTRLYIRLLNEKQLDVKLVWWADGFDVANITIDWGDDSLSTDSENIDDYEGYVEHTYNTIGDYVITIKVNTDFPIYLGYFWDYGLDYVQNLFDDATNILYKVEIGHNMNIGTTAFYGMSSLQSITLPIISDINGSPFENCTSLKHLNIKKDPSGSNSVGSFTQTYVGCPSLNHVSFNISNVAINGLFDGCSSLANVTIPPHVTTLSYGNSNYLFKDCYSLANIYIPPSVKNIHTKTFYNCYGMGYYDFSDHTAVPSLGNTDAFTGIADDCEIRVPAALYDEWTSATNWMTYVDYIVPVGELPEPALPYKNWIPYSTETDKTTIYNGGLGYKNGYRVRSGGAEATTSNGTVTGYIPAKAGDVIRLSGYNALYTANENAINVYDSSLTNLGQSCAGYASVGYGIFTEAAYTPYGWGNANGVKEEYPGIYKWTVPPHADIAYIRVTGHTYGQGDQMIVTVNDSIEYTNLADPTSSDWLAGYCLNGATGAATDQSTTPGVISTNYINCQKGSVVRVKGMNLGDFNVAVFYGDKKCYSTSKPKFPEAHSVWETELEDNGVYKFTIPYSHATSIRFSGTLTKTSDDVIITVDEDIP